MTLFQSLVTTVVQQMQRAVKTVVPYNTYICKKTVVYTRVNGASHIENCKNYKKSDYPPAHRLSVNVLMSNSIFL